MEIGIIVNTIILNQNKEILIIKRSSLNDVESGLWDIPGGTLEPGEDPAMGAIRELKEETGLDINNLKLVAQRSNIDKTKNKQFIRLVFISDYNQEKITLSPEEHDEYRWINPNKIINYNCSGFVPDVFKEMFK